MNIIFPVIELFDRLAIAKVKWQRTQSNKEELEWYTKQISHYNMNLVNDLFTNLIAIHNQIWELESDIRKGYDEQLGLEEIGKRAILIRNYNNERIKIKNRIAEILGCNVKEVKQDHLSQ